MVKKMKFFHGSTKRKPSKKQRRSRKPKFELCKPKKEYDCKKKDKKKKRKEIAKLGLEEFASIFATVRASNQRSREINSEINAYILRQSFHCKHGKAYLKTCGLWVVLWLNYYGNNPFSMGEPRLVNLRRVGDMVRSVGFCNVDCLKQTATEV